MTDRAWSAYYQRVRYLSGIVWPAALTGTALGVAAVSLLLVQGTVRPAGITPAGIVPSGVVPFLVALDVAMVILVAAEFFLGLYRAPVKRNFFRHHPVSHTLLLLFLLFLALEQRLFLTGLPWRGATVTGSYQIILIIRNLFLLSRFLDRLRKLSTVVSAVVLHPARTVAASFFFVILVGALLLMMPVATLDGRGLPLIDAVFTATSAVCVTGLIVVDTATVYTVWGQIVIMLLIQVGGLGIMILSLFTVVIMRHSISAEKQVLLSYMLSETPMSNLASSLKRIVLITFGVELAGATALFFLFAPVAENLPHQILLALFHAVSAFCNAGFALFSTSLEQFQGNPGINGVIAALIIAGGISFAVLTNLAQVIRSRIAISLFHRQERLISLTVNSRAVLLVTALVLTGSFLGFYLLEHGRAMASGGIGIQYLTSFFQAVTLRTAGFNTISLESLATATYLLMITAMFIGGAAGSTAGGLKVNNVAVIAAFLESKRRNRQQTVLFGHALTPWQISTAFSVLVFGLVSVTAGAFFLALTETGTLTDYLFESVSAFATVGLTTGLTSRLPAFGKAVVTVLMFVGRVGPLTLLAASSGEKTKTTISYPTAGISVG
ncbi:trk system potassium uptake protein TrkH [Alkalispirochaeta americana]|uniref:Trk system potassium uptake protein TrkH n=1 Tax=Alkalispirochaeta americana TaxID=159291 RepID=A0A1N6WCW3_9SPIO|nr:potassium transporter TrkG [Alkalispirochaeta americana]SIQ87796.1 trk system potassium uptake protein TrkH [Alkalispirochaeta americana]